MDLRMVLYCSNCGSSLAGKIDFPSGNTWMAKELGIEIEPCEACLLEAHNEGRDEREQEIKESANEEAPPPPKDAA